MKRKAPQNGAYKNSYCTSVDMDAAFDTCCSRGKQQMRKSQLAHSHVFNGEIGGKTNWVEAVALLWVLLPV